MNLSMFFFSLVSNIFINVDVFAIKIFVIWGIGLKLYVKALICYQNNCIEAGKLG